MIIQETSREAYESVGRGKNTLSDKILEKLKGRQFTCDEIEVLLEGRHQSISAQIRHEVISGNVEDSGLRRPTRSGRNAIVWKLVS
jgi:predicted kinase